ncbi:MAG: hypothetical protein ACPGR8_15240 [Limisphaerales bacterium]
MKYFGVLLLSQAVFGLACVIASYPEASAGIVLVSLLTCVAVNTEVSSLSLIALSFETILSATIENSANAYIFIHGTQVIFSSMIIALHN